MTADSTSSVKTTTLDLRGIRCPISTSNLKRYLRGLRPGDTVHVKSDENDARTDFAGVIAKSNAKLVSFTEEPEFAVFTIEKT